MAANAADWLSLDEMKVQLGLEHEDHHDTAITGHIEGAVEWLSGPLLAPLIDRETRIDFTPRTAYDRATLYVPWFVADYAEQRVEYLDPSGDPTHVAIAGRIRLPSRRLPTTVILPAPATGWPDVYPDARGNPYLYRCKVGVPNTHPKKDKIKQALIVAVRDLYNGSRELKAGHILAGFLLPLKEVE